VCDPSFRPEMTLLTVVGGLIEQMEERRRPYEKRHPTETLVWSGHLLVVLTQRVIVTVGIVTGLGPRRQFTI
ncbi:Hypothetical predicted protein, partial [Marmota monax]